MVNTMKKEKEKNMYLTKIIKNELFQTQYVPPVPEPEEEETDDNEGIH